MRTLLCWICALALALTGCGVTVTAWWANQPPISHEPSQTNGMVQAP